MPSVTNQVELVIHMMWLPHPLSHYSHECLNLICHSSHYLTIQLCNMHINQRNVTTNKPFAEPQLQLSWLYKPMATAHSLVLLKKISYSEHALLHVAVLLQCAEIILAYILWTGLTSDQNTTN